MKSFLKDRIELKDDVTIYVYASDLKKERDIRVRYDDVRS